MITVHYRDVGPVIVGKPARVWPINHPGQYVSNNGWALTSPVKGVDLFCNRRRPRRAAGVPVERKSARIAGAVGPRAADGGEGDTRLDRQGLPAR